MKPAGQRNQYLAVWRDVGSTPDAAGHTTSDWQKQFNVWGAVESRVGASREAWSVFRVFATVSHIVTVPYTAPTINEKDQIRLGSRVLNVAGPPVDIDQRNMDIVIPCVEAPAS